jgi:hypothetical protein
MASNAAEGHSGLDLQTMQNNQGHGDLDTIMKSWQGVSADSWQGMKPSEAQLNKPVELKSIPLPTTHDRAEGLAERVANAGSTGLVLLPNERDQIHGGPATNQIYQSIADATSGITHREIDVARKAFSSYSPKEQAEIEREAHSRTIRPAGTNPSEATSHLDAFEHKVEQAISPLERERTAEANKVLAKLPKDVARDKQEEDFFHQHVHAV